MFRNECVAKDAAGREIRIVRWAVGARDRIVELHIPREYIEFAGGCAGFGPNQPDPDCLQPFPHYRVPAARHAAGLLARAAAGAERG